MCKSYKRTGSDGAMDWLVLVAEGRLPQRAMLWMLAIQPSFAIMSLPMLRCFIFHWRFSRSSIWIIRSWSASRRWASSSCRRTCSRSTRTRSYSDINATCIHSLDIQQTLQHNQRYILFQPDGLNSVLWQYCNSTCHVTRLQMFPCTVEYQMTTDQTWLTPEILHVVGRWLCAFHKTSVIMLTLTDNYHPFTLASN